MTNSELQPSDILASVPVTAVVFAVISMAVYFWIIKPLLRPPPRRPAGNNNNNNMPRQRHHRESQAAQESESEILTLLADHTRPPPHMAPGSVRHLDRGGISLVSEGLLPFRYGRAAAYEQSLDAATLGRNRKERARILARLLSLDQSSSAAPTPARGSTIVVSIPSRDVECRKLRRILYLISTFFNVFVILDVQSFKTDHEVDQLVASLRGDSATDLPSEVLPRHRIVASQSITGRIAFVRQLSRVEFVLDFDEEVRAQLGRFGFRVLVYGKDSPATNTRNSGSLLGEELQI